MPEHTKEQAVPEQGDETMAAEQAQLCRATDEGGGGCGDSASASKRDAMPAAVAVPLCLVHDALGVALFLASHPLHTVYLLFFARGLLAVAAFFWPLLVSTSLLLAVLATVGPYVGGAERPGVRSLGRTCGIAVAALCAELRPDADGAPAAAGLVAQLCSFVLGPTDAASVLRVEEIIGEPCEVITASCFVFVPEEEQSLLFIGGGDDCNEPTFGLPAMDGGIWSYIDCKRFLDYESFGDLMDKIDEKVVISEDMKGSDSLAEQCCFPRDTSFVQELEAEEEEEESGIQGQDLVLSAIDDVSDGVDEKRLECDPVSVETKMKKSEPVHVLEIRKSEPMQALGITELEPLEPMEAKKFEALHAVEIKKFEPEQAMRIKKFEPVELPKIKECETVQAVQIKKLQPTLEIKKSEPVKSVEIKKNELVMPRSLIAQRIKLWEAQVSGNVKPIVGDKEENSVEFGLKSKSAKDTKKCLQFEADPCAEKCVSEQQAQVAASTEECVAKQQEQEFKDVKEYMHLETETRAEECSQDIKAEEMTPAVVAQAEQELLEQGCNDVQPEPDLQELEYEIAQPEQEPEEMEEVYSDVAQSPAMWNERESPLKSTSIAGRVHSRTSSENLLISEGSPSWKDKEWKRTLACKLYEERMQLRLCRDRAVVEGSDNMDMLWEAYEVGGGGGNKGRVGKRSCSKAKGSTDKVEDAVEEDEEEEEDDEEDGEEGSVRQLCCLQALKFSTRKMNFGGGKPSLSKISKVLKRMTALSRMGSRRKQSE